MAGTRTGRNEDALSEIVGFVLVLALVVVASTLYLMYVVPAEGREDEIEHMNQVQDRFVSYKTSVDGLWMRSLADLSVPGTRGVSLSTSFDLGTGGGNTQSSGLFLSFMRPIGTAAKMRTQKDTEQDLVDSAIESDWIGIDINDGTPLTIFPGHPDVYYIPIGSLSYHTDNYYWIQQIYSYKLGGVFLEQPGEGVSVKVAPPIAIYQVTNASDSLRKTAKVSLSLVNITNDDSTVGGTGPLRVETRLRESVSAPYRNEATNGVRLKIISPNDNWLKAWRQVFVDAAMKSKLASPADAPKLRDGTHDWFYIPDVTGNIVELYVRNGTPQEIPFVAQDVFLDLSEAPLQVTFEYDE